MLRRIAGLVCLLVAAGLTESRGLAAQTDSPDSANPWDPASLSPCEYKALEKFGKKLQRLRKRKARGRLAPVLVQAEWLAANDRAADAAKLLKRGMKADPEAMDLKLRYAELRHGLGRTKEATTLAEQVLERVWDDDRRSRALTLAGSPPDRTLEKIGKIAGTGPAIVFVPLEPSSLLFVQEISRSLRARLGVPIEIRGLPTFLRSNADRRPEEWESHVAALRTEMRIDDKALSAVLKELGRTRKQFDTLDDVVTHAHRPWAIATRQWEALSQAGGERWTLPRRQWDGGKLLEAMFAKILPHARYRVAYIGVTSADIYLKKWRYGFAVGGGSVERGGRSVMSYARFGSDGRASWEDASWERAVVRGEKQAFISVARSFGIRCERDDCSFRVVMSVDELDAIAKQPCEACEAKLDKALAP